MKRITVLLVDDNAYLGRAFKTILEYEDDLEVVGEAKNGIEAVDLTSTLRPDVILMDFMMPKVNGLYATRQILNAFPATKVLMLSANKDDAYVEEATSSGAIGFLVKQECTLDVCRAIREVHQGGTFFSPSIPKHLDKRNVEK